MTKLTVEYIRENIDVEESQICGYDPCRVFLDSTRTLDNIADEMNVENGKRPFFNYENHPDWEECDWESWYNFIVPVSTNGESLDKICIEDCGLNYVGEIELDDECKQALLEVIWKYYGGKEKYKEAIREYCGNEE